MNAPLVHLVRRSVSQGRAPLLILLHGVGSNEEDLFGLEGAFPSDFTVVSARAPLTLSRGSYAWFPIDFTPEGLVMDPVAAEQSRKILAAFVDWAVAEFGADPRRVIAAGFSQGAIMTASLALTEPEKLKAAVLMSGRILPEVVPAAAEPGRRTKPAYLVVHGTEDRVLPIQNGRESRNTLRSLGIEPEYHEFSMGHTVSDESLALVAEWITSKGKT